MGLYTFLYENLLYRLYFIRIQPPRLVTARLSRYTAHTAYTAIQPYTPYIIQRYTASLRMHRGWGPAPASGFRPTFGQLAGDRGSEPGWPANRGLFST